MKKIIIIVLIILIVLSGGTTIHIYTSHNWKVKSYEYIDINAPRIDCNLTRAQAKKLVKDLYDIPHFYKEKTLKDGSIGHAIIFFRVVEIQKDLPIDTYIITYAHELTHLKYWCSNETWVTYKTFTTLYESGNEILRSIALWDASCILKGGRDGEYDCGYYVKDYLNKRRLL